MPSQLELKNGKALTWAGDLEWNTIEQANNVAQLSFVKPHVALMADTHLGYGVPVGSVIPSDGAIIPSAVGVDIGCGMIAVETTLTASNLPDDMGGVLSRIEAAIPAGVGQGFDEDFKIAKQLHKLGSWVAPLNDKKNTAARQLGTLGSGNHFVEICLDGDDVVWVVLHSGSRGTGNKLAQHHIEKAKGLMKQYFIELPDPDLAYFVQGTTEFDEYVHDLRWAQNYALLNRERMMDAALQALDESINPNSANWAFSEKNRINCHHNYTEMENHFSKNLWITRKGAIRARVGDLGVIPGSMGTNSYIVEGLGNKASFTSASHGAGRVMSRTQARKNLTEESFHEAMKGRTWLDTRAAKLLDEHPAAYKDIQEVMRNQADLVSIRNELHSIVNYKG